MELFNTDKGEPFGHTAFLETLEAMAGKHGIDIAGEHSNAPDCSQGTLLSLWGPSETLSHPVFACIGGPWCNCKCSDSLMRVPSRCSRCWAVRVG